MPPTSLVHHDRLRSLLSGCARDLFAGYGVETCEIAPAVREHDLAGVIGFTGPVRGTLFIASTTAFFHAACPGPTAGPTGDIGDWTAELANQLLGRMKNQLLRRGIEIAVATPVVVRGLRLSCATETPTMYVVLEGGVGVAGTGAAVVVGLEAVSDGPLAWCDDVDAALEEGSLELF